MSKKIRNMRQRKKEDCKTRKNSKDLGRTQRNEKHIECQVCKKRSLIPKIKNMNSETITTKGIANVFAEFDAKINEDDKGENDKEMKQRRAQKTKKRCPCNPTLFQSLQQAKFKMPSNASREEKLETVVE